VTVIKNIHTHTLIRTLTFFVRLKDVQRRSLIWYIAVVFIKYSSKYFCLDDQFTHTDVFLLDLNKMLFSIMLLLSVRLSKFVPVDKF